MLATAQNRQQRPCGWKTKKVCAGEIDTRMIESHSLTRRVGSFLRTSDGRFWQHKIRRNLRLIACERKKINDSSSLEPEKGICCSRMYSPVNRWNIIRPHVIKTGFTRRAFLSTDLTFVTIDLNEYFIGSPLWLMDDKLLFILLSILNLDVRMFERIVSNSSSTFLLEPRSHWRDLPTDMLRD